MGEETNGGEGRQGRGAANGGRQGGEGERTMRNTGKWRETGRGREIRKGEGDQVKSRVQ